MKIIEQSHEILPRGNTTEEVYQLVELAGRVAYKSEDKITTGSAEKFILNMIQRGHESVLEHATVCLGVRASKRLPLALLVVNLAFMQDHSVGFNYTLTKEGALISGNARTFRDIRRSNFANYILPGEVYSYITNAYPVLFQDLESTPAKVSRLPIELLSEERMLEEARAASNQDWTQLQKHIFRTVRFITNRGVTHEIVRHRPPGYTQESTRYCNYFGKEMQFIRPVFWDSTSERGVTLFDGWTRLMNMVETEYNYALSLGAKPQEARDVLTNALKTEIVVTTHCKEWKHIFRMRDDSAAHPQMQALMKPTHADFRKDLPEIFN